MLAKSFLTTAAQLGKNQEALDEYNQVLEKTLDFPTLLRRAAVLTKLGMQEKALADYDQYIQVRAIFERRHAPHTQLSRPSRPNPTQRHCENARHSIGPWGAMRRRLMMTPAQP